MPLSFEPPSSPAPAARATLQQLHKAVFAIALPKTSTARTCTVSLPALHAIRKLLDELVAQPQQPPPDPRVTELASKIDALSDKLDSLAATQPTSYADAVRCSTPSRQHTCSPSKASPIASRAPVHPPQAPSHPAVARDTSLDVVLTPKDSRHPAFIGDSPAVVLARFNELMSTTKPLVYPVSARAVARLRNGNLRLTLNQEGAADDLTDKQALWLPDFSPLLSIHVPLYPIIVHRVPTTFNLYCCASPGPDSSCNGDYCSMMRENSLRFPELPTHARLRWVSPLAKRPSKTHSSIIMFLPYKDLASQIIQERFAINGILLRTEKYHFPPVQCYNCFHFGHTAAHCTRSTVCGCCAGPHTTSDCCCTEPSPCTDHHTCTHIPEKCSLPGCGGSHRSTSRDCPVWRSITEKSHQRHIDSGPLYI